MSTIPLAQLVSVMRYIGAPSWDRDNPAAFDRAWYSADRLRDCIGWFLDYKDPAGTSVGPNGETVLAGRPSHIGGPCATEWFETREAAVDWIEEGFHPAVERITAAALAEMRVSLRIHGPNPGNQVDLQKAARTRARLTPTPTVTGAATVSA